jgi:hypothetical protein
MFTPFVDVFVVCLLPQTPRPPLLMSRAMESRRAATRAAALLAAAAAAVSIVTDADTDAAVTVDADVDVGVAIAARLPVILDRCFAVALWFRLRLGER